MRRRVQIRERTLVRRRLGPIRVRALRDYTETVPWHRPLSRGRFGRVLATRWWCCDHALTRAGERVVTGKDRSCTDALVCAECTWRHTQSKRMLVGRKENFGFTFTMCSHSRRATCSTSALTNTLHRTRGSRVSSVRASDGGAHLLVRPPTRSAKRA